MHPSTNPPFVPTLALTSFPNGLSALEVKLEDVRCAVECGADDIAMGVPLMAAWPPIRWRFSSSVLVQID
jgi:hypothetical protein